VLLVIPLGNSQPFGNEPLKKSRLEEPTQYNGFSSTVGTRRTVQISQFWDIQASKQASRRDDRLLEGLLDRLGEVLKHRRSSDVQKETADSGRILHSLA
jgi:hypothetical protein